MFLTITTTHQPATDLGYLLRKNPARVQSFEQSFGVAHVFDRLRPRGLSAKRSLASREFALGIEGLERFVRQEPLRRVHECVFGVLALESEPVDPRL
jgi:hypothetical protein